MASAYRNFRPVDIATMPKRKLHKLWMKLAFPLTGGEPYCPRCGSVRYTHIKTRKQYRCRDCEHRYSNTSGTMFACRKLPIRDILFGIAEFQDEEDACTAHSFARKMGVSYKTAWVMAHKVRQLMFAARSNILITEDVAVDGAYFGGVLRNINVKKNRNDHRLKKFRHQNKKKVVVIVKGRITNSTILAREFVSEAEAVDWVRGCVPKDKKIFTDEANHWNSLGASHEHHTINHKQAYKIGDNDTNAAESFFSTFRVASKVYRSVSRGYFTAYINEQVWRRTAKLARSNLDRFLDVVSHIRDVVNKFRGYWQFGEMTA